MKNVLKGLAVVLVLFVATQAVNAQQKIGHINSEELMQLTPEFKTATDQLRTLGETKQKELQDMYAEYQKKQTAVNEKSMNRSEANKATVDVEIQGLVEEMRSMEGRLQEVQRASQEEMQKKEQELMAPIQKKIIDAINSVAKEKGYAYIFDLAGGAIVYSAGGDDLTTDIKSKLGIN